MPKITIPANGWRPRPHQLNLWRYLEHGGKRAVEIAHRRWGKDDVALHWGAVHAMERVGGIFHMLPEYAQARKAIWTAVNPHTGKRRIDEAFPHVIRQNTNEQEMFIRFKNGSTWQVVGSDNYDRLVGVSVAGIVFSEWALAKPAAWAYLSPVVSENNGYALFITTPRGRNHALKTLEMARKSPDWFAEISTVDDSKSLSLDIIEQQRREYRALYGEEAGDSLIDQEFYCSFEAALLGAFYAKEMATADREGRICVVEPHEGVPVNTAWDLGIDDAMAIIDWQIAAGQVRILNYEEGHGYGIPYYAERARKRRLEYDCPQGSDYVPHDAKQREMTSSGKDGRAKQRLEVMIECGMKPKVIANHAIADGISAVRQVLPKCWFHETRAAGLADALRAYQTEWDEDARVFKKTALHNWASHGADAKRTLAMAYRELRAVAQPEPGRMLTMDPSTLPVGVKGVRFDDLWAKSAQRSRRI